MIKKTLSYFIVFILLLCSLKSQEQLKDSVLSSNPINLSENFIKNPSALARSFNRLSKIKNGSDSTFVIVHFGDSHIQIGYFSGEFEKNLKSQFGDAGYGVLFPYSACKSLGPYNLKASFKGNWDFNNVTIRPSKLPIGLKGYALRTTDTNSTFDLKYINNESYPVQTAIIFHGADNYNLVLSAISGDTIIQSEKVSSKWNVTKIPLPVSNPEVSLKFKKTDEQQNEFLFSGVLFEGNKKGIQYHHCGVVGAHFFQISRKNSLLIPQLKYLKPDLIIFSYGSNETYLPEFDSLGYYKEISSFIEQIRKEIPEVEFLITLTPDTKSNNRRPVHKMAINRTLEKIALKTNSAYWDLNLIMGGDNSMVKWKANGLAQKDKLHFFRTGYYIQGDLLSIAFLNAYNKVYANSIETESLMEELTKKMEDFKISVDDDIVSKQQNNNTSTRTKTHIVKKGDTLNSLSKKYKCSVDAIKKANNMKNSLIKIGEKLIIP